MPFLVGDAPHLFQCGYDVSLLVSGAGSLLEQKGELNKWPDFFRIKCRHYLHGSSSRMMSLMSIFATSKELKISRRWESK